MGRSCCKRWDDGYAELPDSASGSDSSHRSHWPYHAMINRESSPGRSGASVTAVHLCSGDCAKPGSASFSPAEGAFYLFADIADRSNDSTAFCARMLAEVGIAATPGVDFDHARGNRFLRFSYCGPEDDMQVAATRLKAWR
jgi:hypothetical protein